MDEIDIAISLMLMANSRIPYREFAEIFNMSVNSIHKRIKSMVDLKIIQNFQTKLGYFHFPNMVNLIMFGTSTTKNKREMMQKIGNHECVYNITQASGNLFYFHAHIRNLKDLDTIVSFIRKEGEINELTVGLDKGPPSGILDDLGDNAPSKLDYLIINALKNNSRKTISDVSNEIGVSTKTVGRHLNRLIEKNLVNFTIDWYPDKTSEILSIIILNSNPSTDFDNLKFIDELRKQYGPTVIFHWEFSNLPNLLLICVWVQSMKELQEIESFLLSRNFKSVNVTILVEGKMFSTWRDTYLEDKIKELKNKSN